MIEKSSFNLACGDVLLIFLISPITNVSLSWLALFYLLVKSVVSISISWIPFLRMGIELNAYSERVILYFGKNLFCVQFSAAKIIDFVTYYFQLDR